MNKKDLKRLLSKLNLKEVQNKRHIIKTIEEFYNTDNSVEFLNLIDSDAWRNLLIGMVKDSFGEEITAINEMIEGFLFERIKLIQKSKNYSDYSMPIVVFTQKNNLSYLKTLLPYYRSMGIVHFIIIDNNSSEETMRFLREQQDVTLYSAPYKFTGNKKAGWKLQAVAEYGLNHWYLWIDSDEFFVYPRMETISLSEYISILESKGITNVGGFMLDMYPDYGMMDESHNPDNFYSEYIFFDKYSDYYRLYQDQLLGGMRNRVLGLNNIRLDKTPLIYCTEKNVPLGNHRTFPRKRNVSSNYGSVLKHYKFLSTDKNIYLERAKDKESGYANLRAQEKYADLIGEDIVNSLSIKYENTDSLSSFTFLHDFTKDR